jgi:hypothetical protein
LDRKDQKPGQRGFEGQISIRPDGKGLYKSGWVCYDIDSRGSIGERSGFVKARVSRVFPLARGVEGGDGEGGVEPGRVSAVDAGHGGGACGFAEYNSESEGLTEFILQLLG